MYCRIPRKIKRYMTDPDEIEKQLKSKDNNLNLQENQVQLNPFQALNQIRVPIMPNNRPNNQKKPNTVTPIQQRYQQQINTRKKLSKKYLFPYSNNKGYELPQNSKLALAFKRSNPLFVVNSLIDILKDDSIQITSASLPDKNKISNIELYNKEFQEFQIRNIKIPRAPRLIQNELNLLAQQSRCESRKIYSEQKSRQKLKNVGEVELLTFYKAKRSKTTYINQEFS